jgi:hypothetical protein
VVSNGNICRRKLFTGFVRRVDGAFAFREMINVSCEHISAIQGDMGTALISMLLVSAITAVPAMREFDHGN